ncbi:MAG: hypothetical protein LAO07_08070 [Acidobacteriia bacterium]|nr:hypothetical protein [Terriglobia bacterium]
MGTSPLQPPQPPRGPAGPPPPRTGSHILTIALLFLALIIVVSLATVWVGLRFLAHGVSVNVQERDAGRKEVSIKTPVGSMQVSQDVNESGLGLPIYPGAERLRDQDSANLSFSFGGEAGLRLIVAKFETPDPPEKVRDFYKKRLGGDVTRFVEKDSEGKTVFEIKRSGQEKVVALESRGGGTRIALVRVNHGPTEAN